MRRGLPSEMPSHAEITLAIEGSFRSSPPFGQRLSPFEVRRRLVHLRFLLFGILGLRDDVHTSQDQQTNDSHDGFPGFFVLYPFGDTVSR